MSPKSISPPETGGFRPVAASARAVTRPILITELFVGLMLLAMSLPALLAPSLMSVSADVVVDEAQAFLAWLENTPRCRIGDRTPAGSSFEARLTCTSTVGWLDDAEVHPALQPNAVPGLAAAAISGIDSASDEAYALDPPLWLKAMVMLALLALAGFAMRFSGWRWSNEVRGLGALRTWGWVAVALLADRFLGLLFGAAEGTSGVAQFHGLGQPLSSWQLLLILGLGPLVEEAIFRQYLHGALSEVLPMWLVALITAVMFVFAHFLVLLSLGSAIELSLGVFALLVASLLLTLVRHKSEALLPCVIVHSVFNLATLVEAGMPG
ncbi:MAG: hypothetical protein KatS3mg127_2152 [Silanimonas sp.]|nr:MAG: hypothetical protein KatS3mg127_2152 [Silanimonas sp.]